MSDIWKIFIYFKCLNNYLSKIFFKITLLISFSKYFIWFYTHIKLNVMFNKLFKIFIWIYSIKYSNSINGQSDSIMTHIPSDNSGYYIPSKDNSNAANLWKYQFSSSTTCQCQQITGIQNYLFGQLKLSDDSFFMLSNDPSYTLHLFKIAFSSTSPVWARKMVWSSGTWTASISQSLKVSSNIYSFFTYGSTQYLYFTVFSESDGSILSSRYSRYKTVSEL